MGMLSGSAALLLGLLTLGYVPTEEAAPTAANRLESIFAVKDSSVVPASFSPPDGSPTDVSDSAEWHPLDTLELFGGFEGSKQPQDFGVNAHFGGRVAVNWSAPIVEDWGLGFQIGTAGNFTDHAVRVTSKIDGAGSRQQSFTTVGLFQRTLSGLSWGVVHDFLYERDYDTFTLSQWRAQIGYEITERDEVGVFGMAPQHRSDGLWANVAVGLAPIAQVSAYWRHTWQHDAQLGFWVGGTGSHGQVNVALGDDNRTHDSLVFGSDLHVPISDSWALFGQANFICPADTGTVDAFLGLTYYPAANAHGWRRRLFSPVLAVANNTSFSVDLRRK